MEGTVSQRPLWMASYNGQDPQTGAPGSTSPWSSWNFWQYSSTGSVPGVPSTNCDKDTFNGTAAQLNSWIIMASPTTPTGPTNGQQLTGSPASLNWTAVTNATSYDVYLDNVLKANVAGTSWTVSPAISNGMHNWYVIAHNNTGVKTGPTWNFTVNATITLNAPTNTAITSTTNSAVSLSWTDNSTNEQNYLIERKTGSAGT